MGIDQQGMSTGTGSGMTSGTNSPGFDAMVESAIAGDRESLNRLWMHSRRWVAAILIAHKPREADLEDLLQVVALQVCRKISSIEEPKAFKSWLRTVATNTAREEGRKTTRRKKSMLRLVGREQGTQASPVSADTIMCDTDESQRIYQAAMSLPVGYREPVLLRCMRSMSYQQIGDVLDLPTTTIETRIARGRRMLKELLAQQDPPGSATHQRDHTPAAVGGAR